MSNSAGMLSVLREVSVRQASANELVVICREPRDVGEVLTLETLVNGEPAAAAVRVITSVPVVRNGMLFHELRLERLASANGDGEIR